MDLVSPKAEGGFLDSEQLSAKICFFVLFIALPFANVQPLWNFVYPIKNYPESWNWHWFQIYTKVITNIYQCQLKQISLPRTYRKSNFIIAFTMWAVALVSEFKGHGWLGSEFKLNYITFFLTLLDCKCDRKYTGMLVLSSKRNVDARFLCACFLVPTLYNCKGNLQVKISLF